MLAERSNCVQIYDSMYSSKTSSHVRKQLGMLSYLFIQDSDELIVQHMNMQHQIGGNDCGLFAIAALCYGDDSSTHRYFQNKRAHLRSCISSAHLTPFPSQRKRRANTIKCMEYLPLYCVCRSPVGTDMVMCNKCRQWFHPDCVNVPDLVFSSASAPYVCPKCC